MIAVLGRPDPAGAPNVDDVVCAATSDLVPGATKPFTCNRLPGHTTYDREHVASAPLPGVGRIAVAAWVDGGAPRVIEPDTVRHLQRRGRPL